MSKKISLFVLLVTLFTAPGFAAIPETISYQGRLTKKDGSPVDPGLYPVTLSLYTAENASTAVWVENQTVETKNGYFSCALGTQTSFASQGVQFNQPYYLGVKVGTEPEMSPRMQLQSVPYAIYAQNHPIVTTEKIQDGAITQAKAPNALFFQQPNIVGEFGTCEINHSSYYGTSLHGTVHFTKKFKSEPLVLTSIKEEIVNNAIIRFLVARADQQTLNIYIPLTATPSSAKVLVNWFAFGEKE
jgi:hypothetical protein